MRVLTHLWRVLIAPVAIVVCGLSAISHPLDTWHTRELSSGSGYFQDVCHGNGLFVAVGISGRIVTSPTGETWGSQNSGTNVLLEGVAYGDGQFVVVGEGGTVLTSADGTNWTKQISGVTTHLYSVQFGSGLFVAAGASNLILTSQDGQLWSAQTSAIPFQTSFIAYGNGLFVMEGGTGTNVVSTDGTNWFQRPSGSAASLYTMGFGDGVFLSIDLNLNTFISSDASNWVQQASVTVIRPSAVAFGNGHFVTGGSGGMQYCTRGSPWKLASVAFLPRGICFGDGDFVAVGYTETIVQSDPIIWLQPQAAGSQIVTSGLKGSPTHGIKVVLQSTPDFVNWTSLSTNTLPYPFRGAITNTVEPTNPATLYRVYIPNP